tara:strand:+ start:8428 stop:9582 length:1155 start_codon:yes stop_codon:yes gene_type:complete
VADNIVWSTIYLGNFSDMDTNEGSYSVEDASALLTTFGAGPGNALSNAIVDVHTWGGGDNAVQADNTGTSDYIQYDLGAGPQTATIDSGAALTGTATFHDGTTYSSMFGVFQDTNGNVFLLVMDDQPELASQGLDTITFTSVAASNFSGVSQFALNDHDFVCLAPGARIATPDGPVRMDRLRRGDLVTTLDSGPQPIRWIGKRRQRFDPRPHPGQPICIAKGAFGPGLPWRDLIVSPNHRVLMRTQPTFALHDPLGALAPAKALTRLAGVRPQAGRRAITYFTLLLPRHEVIIADGLAVESLFPGPEVFASLDGIDRSHWLRLAGRDGRVTGTPPARLLLTTSEARAAIDTHQLHAPETAPVPLSWSGARHRARPRPAHLAKRA